MNETGFASYADGNTPYRTFICSEYEKLLRIKVDTKLNFKEHLNDIISTASRKAYELSK